MQPQRPLGRLGALARDPTPSSSGPASGEPEQEDGGWPNWLRFLALCLLILGSVFCYTAACEYLTARQIGRLQRVGVRAEAEVTGYYPDQFCRRVCLENVRFQFAPAPSGSGGLVASHATFLGVNHDRDYRLSLVSHRVPIVYDPADPTQSMLNYRDEVFSRDPMASLMGALEQDGVFLLVVLTIAGFVLAISRRRRPAL